MNTKESTLTANDRALLDAWLAEIREIRDTVAAPMLDGDPRMEVFDAATVENMGKMTPEEWGELYFWKSRPELPAWPLPLPLWAEDVKVSTGTFPEITVRFVGQSWTSPNEAGGEFSARIEEWLTVFADDHEDESGSFKRGDIETNGPRVQVPQINDELTCWDALALATVIEDAAVQLRDFLKG